MKPIYEICLKITKYHRRVFVVVIVNFEEIHFSEFNFQIHIFVVFLLLTLRRKMSVGNYNSLRN